MSKSKSTEFNTLLDTISEIASEVIDECIVQHETWGQQDHPSIRNEVQRYRFGLQAENWKQSNAARVADESLSWDGILLEEVYEALAEGDEDRIREELVQVAAVAISWIGAIDRRVVETPKVDDCTADEEASA